MLYYTSKLISISCDAFPIFLESVARDYFHRPIPFALFLAEFVYDHSLFLRDFPPHLLNILVGDELS